MIITQAESVLYDHCGTMACTEKFYFQAKAWKLIVANFTPSTVAAIKPYPSQVTDNTHVPQAA